MSVEKYHFIKGEEVSLDEIYAIQGLGGGDWWDHKDEGDNFPSNQVIITRNIKIKIVVTP